MSLLDRVFIDPDLDDLVGSLTGAGIVSGAGAPDWRAWFAETSPRREGQKSWSGRVGSPPRNTRVAAVWWTDWVGRRHWRVLAWQPPSVPRYYPRQGRPSKDLPPVALLYPGWISVRRSRDGVIEAVAACNCGAVGTLAQVAWMGPSCGPCHDRAEESAKPPPEACHYLITPPDETWAAPAFSRDGRLLATETPGEIQVWEVRTGRQWARLPQRGQALQSLAFSPDGQLLLAAGGSDQARRSRIHGWDLGTRESITPQRIDHEVVALSFSPNSRRLALTWGGGLEVWNLVSRRNWRLDYSDSHFPEVVSFDGKGDRLLVGGAERGALIDLKDKRRHPIAFPRGERLVIQDVAFDPGGEPLLLTLESPRWSGQGLLRVREGKGAGSVRMTLESRTEDLSECRSQFTPDARHVIVRHAGRGTLRFWESAAGSYLGALWSCGSEGETQVVFSPDGNWLTTTLYPENTVRLWPWRALLGLAPSR